MGDEKKDRKSDLSETIGNANGNVDVSKVYADNVIFHSSQPHGAGGEKLNHLYDKMLFKDAELCGISKNGPDRIVNGELIQTKFCSTGAGCINDCFDATGNFKYYTKGVPGVPGVPMKIEVPSDKYDEAIISMKKRISDGKVKGVADPADAEKIVIKSIFTYKQAQNVAIAGTIESITYDAVNGIIVASGAMGISGAIAFATNIWNGEDIDVALENSISTGITVFGSTWATNIIVSQLGRTGIEQTLRPFTDAVVKKLGYKVAAKIATGVGKNTLSGAAAANYVSKFMRGNIVTNIVTTAVLSGVDIFRAADGKISGQQLFKNITKTAAGVVGGSAGWVIGASIGSVIPIIGTAIGGFLGALAGSALLGTAASSITGSILDEFIEDDSKKMMEIFNQQYQIIAYDYLLNENEVKKINDVLAERDFASVLREMYAAEDREQFALELLEEIAIEITKGRSKIIIPDETSITEFASKILVQVSNQSIVDDIIQNICGGETELAVELVNKELVIGILEEPQLELLVYSALSNNNSKVFSAMIDKGFDISNLTVSNVTKNLVENCGIEPPTLIYLIENGLNIFNSKEGESIFDTIVKNKNWKYIQTLLEKDIGQWKDELISNYLNDCLDTNLEFNVTLAEQIFQKSKNIDDDTVLNTLKRDRVEIIKWITNVCSINFSNLEITEVVSKTVSSEVLEVLLEYGKLDANLAFNNKTILEIAIVNRKPVKIAILLKYGAEFDRKNIQGMFEYSDKQIEELFENGLAATNFEKVKLELIDNYKNCNKWDNIYVLLKNGVNVMVDNLITDYSKYIIEHGGNFDYPLLELIIQNNGKYNKFQLRKISVDNESLFKYFKNKRMLGFYPLAFLPGFRTIKKWKMATGFIYYAIVALLCTAGNDGLTQQDKLIYDSIILLAFIVPEFYMLNFLNIKNIIPGGNNKVLRNAIYPIVIIITVGVFASNLNNSFSAEYLHRREKIALENKKIKEQIANEKEKNQKKAIMASSIKSNSLETNKSVDKETGTIKLPIHDMKVLNLIQPLNTSSLSDLQGQEGNLYSPKNVTDQDYNTAWVEGEEGDGIGSWLLLGYGTESNVKEINFLNGYTKNEAVYNKNGRVKRARIEFSNGNKIEVEFEDAFRKVNKIKLEQSIKTTYIKFTILEVYKGTDFSDTCISEISALEEVRKKSNLFNVYTKSKSQN